MINFEESFFEAKTKVSINLTNLNKELKCAKIANHCPELSFKKIGLYFSLAAISITPSCLDTGSDINQGQLYLNGDFYTKQVNNTNDLSIINYNCTLMETNRKFIGDNEEVTYTYICFEKDEYFGYFTLAFVFIFPGLVQAIKFFVASGSLEAHRHKIIGYGIGIGLLLLSPLFPFQVFLVKLLAFLTDGPEMKKISTLMTFHEAQLESQLQFLLQIYVIFTRADRQPSIPQILSLSSSILFMAKSWIETWFADKPNEPFLKKLTLLPTSVCFAISVFGFIAMLSSIFGILTYLTFVIATRAFVFCLSCICMKARISQGQGCFDQRYRGMTIIQLVLSIEFYIILAALLVMINHFPDTTIYSIEFNTGLRKTKLSDITLVKENWANYVIPTILVSGVICAVLSYKQFTKQRETIQISNKDDQQDIYKITRGALQDSPLETEVVKISVDGKTFIVPKDDLDIEKYPQELETKTMVKSSNEKDGCFKNLKKKVSCSVEDETPKPIKAYIVKIEVMKEMTVDSENNIDGQQNTGFDICEPEK